MLGGSCILDVHLLHLSGGLHQLQRRPVSVGCSSGKEGWELRGATCTLQRKAVFMACAGPGQPVS